MSKFDLNKFGKKVSPGAINYIQLMNNVVEDYPLGIAHGLQKDAVQNGSDARPENKKIKGDYSDWRFDFILQEGKNGHLLIFEDFGTVGLTGELTADDIKTNSYPSQNERWARWESLAFNKVEASDLGARGQGKLVMFASSENRQMAYDSLREDGTYRSGLSEITELNRGVVHGDEEQGKKAIRDMVGLTPITHKGTRVIIQDPLPDIRLSIENGDFTKWVEETWWPIILKGGEINVVIRGVKTKADAPIPIKRLIDTVRDTKDFKIWKKKNIRFEYGKGSKHEKFNIEQMHFAYDKDGVPEDHRGIAVFRGGMKVTTIDFPSFQREGVYGYVICDKNLDTRLREQELPNHYGFRTRGVEKNVWIKLKQIIEGELQEFAEKKLGMGAKIEISEETKKTNAENRAMSILKDITRDWDLLNFGSTVIKPPGPSNPPSIPKLVFLRIKDFVFPDDPNIPRLNYGQAIEDFKFEAVNNSDESVEYIFDLSVFLGLKKILTIDKRSGTINTNQTIVIPENSGFSLKINNIDFPSPGIYKLTAQLINAKTKQTEHELNRIIYVEQDPIFKGPFEVKPLNFPRDLKDDRAKHKLQWFLDIRNDKITLYYNIGHPAYMQNNVIESNLSKYLAEIYASGALQLQIMRIRSGEVNASEFNLPFKLDVIAGDDPVEAYKEIQSAIAHIKDLIYRY